MSRRRRFVVTPEARADLIEIWKYIAEDSVDAADQAIARLDDAFQAFGTDAGDGPSPRRLGRLTAPFLDG
jgi:plasmid stabilization system protein ParE